MEDKNNNQTPIKKDEDNKFGKLSPELEKL